MKKNRALFLILLVLLTAPECFSQKITHPDIEPLFLPETVLQESQVPAAGLQVLSADEVFKLSLLFSECQLDSLTAKRCLEKFGKIKAEVSGKSYMDLAPEERGRAVLKLLYRDYLKAYDFDQTKTDVALESGLYNCVSSALLYMAAAKACGLDVRGQRTTQHAFCSIYVPGQKAGQFKRIDVETTNPYGFNPGSRETIENEAKIQKYYVVPKKYYSNRQEVSDRAFVGVIAANICSDCIKSGDYVRAVPVGAARYETVRNEKTKATADVRQEFDILAANYVNLNPESAEIYSDVVEWYTGFIERWGMTAFLQKNMDSAFNNLLVLCSKEDNYPLAVESFEKYKKFVSPKQVSKTEEIKADILFATETSGYSYYEQIIIINGLLEIDDYQSLAYQNRGKLYLENAWLMILNDYMNKKDFQTGLKKSDEALLQLPQSTKIKNMKQNFYSNSIAIIHNDFAKQANAGNYEDALDILSAGMQDFPDDKTLKNDYSALLKILNR